MSHDLLAAGSIARDTLETSQGTVVDQLGGSALYFSLAASMLQPITLVAPVGEDAEDQVRAVTSGRSIDLAGMSTLATPTYRWHARHAGWHNIDLGSQDRIYELWRPALPVGFDGWAFVGSMRPRLQVQIAERLERAELLAGDSMLSYAVSEQSDALRLLELCTWFFSTGEELSVLGGDPNSPAGFKDRWALAGLCVKDGRQGVRVLTADGVSHVAGLSGQRVVDTTGAGDAFAGGMLSRWLTLGGARDDLLEAIVWGVACASITIEAIGLEGIAAATIEQVTNRAREVRDASGQDRDPDPHRRPDRSGN
jgi:sugar/nucleoside kinase (ribokinase family)